jgi:chemotaxis protein MotB
MKTYSKNKVNIIRKREAEPWIYSYADLVTNLLAFFMMMLIMASANKGKKDELIKGIEEYVKGKSMMGLSAKTDANPDVTNIPELKQIIQDYIGDNDLASQVSLSALRDGIEMTFEGALVFDSGTAVITQQAELILGHIGSLLKKLPPKYSIDVEGHADARPIDSSRFPSNWELSSARAGSVVRFLEGSGIKSLRLRAIGYSSTQPLGEDGMAPENRRVVIKVIGRGEQVR